MRQRLTLACLLALAVGAVLTNVGAQSNSRLFASLVSQLTTGGSTPITCTQSGSGCYLDVSIAGGGGTFTSDISAPTLALGTNPATTGTLRLPHAGTIIGRNSANTVDVTLLNWGSSVANELVIGTAGVPMRNRTSLATPASAANGDWWVDCSGTSPSRVCAIKVQDGGATRTIASVTY